jgi:hypothetical protein
MAVGFVKKNLARRPGEDPGERKRILDKMNGMIASETVPVRPDRRFPRQSRRDNRHGITKRRAF